MCANPLLVTVGWNNNLTNVSNHTARNSPIKQPTDDDGQLTVENNLHKPENMLYLQINLQITCTYNLVRTFLAVQFGYCESILTILSIFGTLIGEKYRQPVSQGKIFVV